jgi:hypothetical protein
MGRDQQRYNQLADLKVTICPPGNIVPQSAGRPGEG